MSGSFPELHPPGTTQSPLAEGWDLFSRHWQARWVLVILAGTRIVQAVAFTLMASVRSETIGVYTLAVTTLGEVALALCLAWLGSALLHGPRRNDVGRWRIWILLYIAYSLAAIGLGWLAGTFTATVTISAFPNGGMMAAVLATLVATLPPTLLLMPLVVRLLLQAGGYDHPRLSQLLAVLWGGRKAYLVTYVCVAVGPMLAMNVVRSLLGWQTNGAYVILGLVGGMALAFALLVALAAATRLADGREEAERVFG